MKTTIKKSVSRRDVATPKANRGRHIGSKHVKSGGCAVFAAWLAAASSPVLAGDGGKITINERYRYETVSQESRPLDAHASTLRSRIGFISPKFQFVRFGAEFENIVEIGDDDFNNTINGNTNRPVVVDVRSREVNQAYLELFALPKTRIVGGRYKKNIDNMRFIGSVDWRQNDQTFDGATVTTNLIPNTELFYGYIGNVNRIFSDRSAFGNLASNIHLVNAQIKNVISGSTLSGYVFLIDIDDIDRLSNASYGLSLVGQQGLFDDLKFKYRFEYARQTDYGDNPLSYEADYYHLAPALVWRGFTLTLGLEFLGSDSGVAAFQTPLATGHVFNGFADIFLATPALGLEDRYIDLTYKVKGLSGPLKLLNGLLLKAQYHDFTSDVGGLDYGTEFDFYTKLPLKHGFYVEAKYADYSADQFGTDTEKFIFGLGFKTEIGLDTLRNRIHAEAN